MTFSPAQQIALAVGGLILVTCASLVIWPRLESAGGRHWDRLKKWMEIE